MKKQNPLKTLENLADELTKLAEKSIPVQTQAAIQAALQKLEQLQQSLPEYSEKDKLPVLYKISQSLGTSLNLDDIFNQMMDAVIQTTGVKRGFLTLVDQDTGELKIYAARNVGHENDPQNDMETSLAVIQSVISTGKGIVTTDSQDDSQYANQDPININALRSVLCAPLKSRGKTIGAIYADNQTRTNVFTVDDLEMLNAVASQAAIAIENARLFQDVQDINESKSQFISIVTHELRIPLTSIKGYTDLIRQGVVGPINEQQTEFLNVIRNNTDRMAALISNLSDVSRIERGILKLDPVFLHTHGYVNETLNRLRPKIEEKKQQLKIAVPLTLPEVYADPNRLIQILTNLVNNAWKYTPDGGKIIIRAVQIDDSVQIEVIDNGIGISEEDQDKLFTQFFRSESPYVREQTGWGLGLNVTKMLVEVMGGEIGMSSSLGDGSIFWFNLPTQKPEFSS